MVGTTVNKRIRQATRAAEALITLPAGAEQSARVVQAKILPMALYGASAAPVASADVSRLSSAIVRAIDPGAA
eukprot:13756505-Alexandrium_andersonii.AAC.1